jgi:uncharacterized protein YggE
MKTHLALLTGLSLLLVQSCSFAQQPNPASLHLITVSGTGEVKLVPNEAMFNIGVEARAKEPEDARKQSDTKVANILGILKSKGVDSKDVQTTYMTLYPGYDPHGSQDHISFYTAHKNMTVTIKNLDKLDEIMTSLTKAGVNHVDGMQYKNSEMKPSREQARKLALQAAKQKATSMAGELGTKVGRVHTINEHFNEGPQPYLRNANMASVESSQADGGGPSFSPGQLNVVATVEVSFVLE